MKAVKKGALIVHYISKKASIYRNKYAGYYVGLSRVSEECVTISREELIGKLKERVAWEEYEDFARSLMKDRKEFYYVELDEFKMFERPVGYREVVRDLGFKPPQRYISLLEENIVREILSRGFLDSSISYNPYLLQGLTRLSVNEYLSILGCIASKLIRRDSWNKEDVESLVSEACREIIGAEECVEYVKILNDLRCLGILRAGNPDSEEWRREIEGKVVSWLIERSRYICNNDLKRLGAIMIVTAISMRDSKCLRILRRLWANGEDALYKLVEELGSKVEASKDGLRKLLEKELQLIEHTHEISKDLASKGVAIILLPIESWGETS
ncbi:MAG: hypothetical protein DRJ37_06255 [Thermoprotei archaeon]|nr:MAG: hypothetical protein DRJ37_06255 [Thermoprotei archaeon]